MSDYFLKENDFKDFVQRIINEKRVLGPKAKKNKFVFDRIESADEIRLDYDVTILPPKKAFFPTKQDLIKFEGNKPTSCINPTEQVLFGVHFYDIKAIDMLDYLFNENNVDNNYLANRHATTVVGSSIQKISDRAFFGSVGSNVTAKGHDAFITKLSTGYHVQTLTEKGEELISFGQFTRANDKQINEAKELNAAVMNACKEKLHHSTEEISKKLRASFDKDHIWEKASEKCFSCGSCNIVCPTCYCFDVQDEWNLDQQSGVRSRSWDGCLMEDFAKVSLGPSGSENFRHDRSQRFRHRIMRKTTYLNAKLQGPACVGCGRCSIGCVPDIADPVNVINKVMEG